MKAIALTVTMITALVCSKDISVGSPAPSAPAPAAAVAESPAPFHCQVPCGVYGDKMRIDMIMEDCATIEKGMAMLGQLGGESPINYNQIVRWTMTKDDHSARIQENVASYWLAQRIKAPKNMSDKAADAKYGQQLRMMHTLTVAAMKCKQTTDVAWVQKIRKTALDFSATYFSAEDLKHLHDHHKEHGH